MKGARKYLAALRAKIESRALGGYPERHDLFLHVEAATDDAERPIVRFRTSEEEDLMVVVEMPPEAARSLAALIGVAIDEAEGLAKK